MFCCCVERSAEDAAGRVTDSMLHFSIIIIILVQSSGSGAIPYRRLKPARLEKRSIVTCHLSLVIAEAFQLQAASFKLQGKAKALDSGSSPE